VAPHNRCLLERFGAPASACRIFFVFLLVFIPGYFALMFVSGSIGHSRLWYLPLFTTPLLMILILTFLGRRDRR
jgi:hypothetical protein